ncbi:MAG: hypothetical protein ACYDA1_00580 [Vulcanimicrobiaceae bacterium]
MGSIAEVVFASILALISVIGAISQFAPASTTVRASAIQESILTIGTDIQTLCVKTQNQCLSNGTALASGPIVDGEIEGMPNPPMDTANANKPFQLNIVADTTNAAQNHFSIDSGSAWKGTDLQAGGIPVIAAGKQTQPVAATVYYIHYDGCIGRVFASTSATTTPTQCTQ